MPASRRLSRRVLDDETGADDRAGRHNARVSLCSGPVSLFIHASQTDGRASSSAVWRFHSLGRLGLYSHKILVP
eukprot:6258441-Prymnesium_polylepis.1